MNEEIDFNLEDFNIAEDPSDEPDLQVSSKELLEIAKKNGNLHEAIREIVFDTTKDIDFGKVDNDEEVEHEKAVKEKRKEIYDILDNLSSEVKDKSPKEVAAIFTSMMDIQSQLCLEKTDGVITVRTLLKNFFNIDTDDENIRKFRYQEITLIFTPEEVHSVRRKLSKIDDSHPLFPFFTSIVDQAYDVVQYNEMSGRLLIEITNYFLSKLAKEGYDNTSHASDFKERHTRSQNSFNKVLDDFRDDERIIKGHLENYPVLVELPRYLRLLIYIKLGVTDPKHLKSLLQNTRGSIGKYARARGATQFDFKRFFSQQHNILRRQRIMLKLHKDIVQYMGELFEEEFQSCMKELQGVLDEIEATSETLDPNSPEYESLMRKKAAAQRNVEERKKKLDVIKSQERLIDVQHQMITNAMDRFDNNEEMNRKIEEQLRKTQQKAVMKKDASPAKKRA
ncbi:hypothetical protein K8I31_18735, partial [bacterium]|nr:hypothetical protein [bacterium]